MFNIKNIPVDEIVIEERFRKDLGNLEALKESILTVGLLQPIGIDSNNRLLFGGRRTEAIKQLHLEGKHNGEVAAICFGTLSTDEQFILELVENNLRKDFIWHEELALKKRIHSEFCAKNQKWSEAQTAEKLGITPSNMSSDLRLAGAIAVMPELKTYDTKTQAKAAFSKMEKQARAVLVISKLPSQEKARLQDLIAEKYVPPAVANEEVEELVETEVPENSLPPVVYRICHWSELLATIPDMTIGLAELDPPYAIGYKENGFDDWTGETFEKEMKKLCHEMKPKLAKDAWVLCWTAFEWINFLQDIYEEAGYKVQRPGVWVKPSGSVSSPATNMVSNYEYFLLFRWGNPQFTVPSLPAAIVCPTQGDRCHPTEKPVTGLYNLLVGAMSSPAHVCFVPFAGSGNSLIAATKNSMLAMGSDIIDTYRNQFFINFMQEFGR